MLLPFFTWCESTAVGEAIRASLWLFPAIESVHLLALALLGGTVIAVSLRLLGLTLTKQPVPQLWHDLRLWLMGSLSVMLASGLPLFLSESIKLYYSDAFWVKMSALALASAFTFTAVRRVALAPHRRPLRDRVVGFVALVLWLTVGAAGRWIGFS